jgi:hypothetical protein
MRWELGAGSWHQGKEALGTWSVVPFSCSEQGAAWSGELTFRIVEGRLSCVGLAVGDSVDLGSAVRVGAAGPPISTALFRAIPWATIIASAAAYLSGTAGYLALARAVEAALAGDGEPMLSPAGRPILEAFADQAAEVALAAEMKRPGPRPRHDDAFYRDVARVYREAWHAGDKAPAMAVAYWARRPNPVVLGSTVEAPRSTVAKWIAAARRRGFLGQTTPRRARA